MERDSYEHGVPSWIDLGTPDPEAAAMFYGELFGWHVEQGPPEAGGYAMAMLRGKLVAGLGPQQNPGPAYWSTYVNVDDADAIATAVEAGGGKTIVSPMDVMTAGRVGIFADPTGAAFGVWQPADMKGAQLVNEPNTWCWSELLTTDLAGSKQFYGSVFGWGGHSSGPDDQPYTEWQVGDRSVGGMMAKPAEAGDMPNAWIVYFTVDDVEATTQKVRELGGSVTADPMDVGPGRIAILTDPTGGTFGVIRFTEQPD
jgi:predicted enzyme related to lactoylglutathione lyase